MAKPAVVPTVEPDRLLTAFTALADVPTTNAWPLTRWQTLAQDPSLFKGWRKTTRKGNPLVLACARLAVKEVAELLNVPHNWSTRSAWSDDMPAMSALAAVLSTVPKEHRDYPNMESPWSPAQRASQEVIVGLLLAAGAPVDALAWVVSAPSHESFGRQKVNARMLDRLLACTLATGQNMPSLTVFNGNAPTSLPFVMAHTPWIWSPTTVETVMRHHVLSGQDLNALFEFGTIGAPSERTTALHVAIDRLQQSPSKRRENALAFVHALLRHGADPSVPNTDGARPIHVAAEQHRADAMVLLVEHGATWDSLWVRPESTGRDQHQDQDPDAVGAPADASRVHAQTTFNGWMPIHVAAAHATTLDTLDQLLAWGAGHDTPDLVHFNTALHVAAFYHNDQAVERLLDAGASPDLLNRADQTPRDLVGLFDPANPNTLTFNFPESGAAAAIRRRFERWDLHKTMDDAPEIPMAVVRRPRERL